MVDLSSSMRRSENGCQEETRARVTSSWLIPGNFTVFSVVHDFYIRYICLYLLYPISSFPFFQCCLALDYLI